MNGKRLVHPVAWAAIAILGLALLSYGEFRFGALGRRLERLEKTGEARFGDVAQELKDIRKQVLVVVAQLRAADDGLVEEPGTEEPEIRFAKLADAEALIKNLGDSPSASDVSQVLATIDGWLIEPGQEEPFRKIKLGQETRLRQVVKTEVMAHQEAAVKAISGSKAAEELALAARTLVLYPQSDDSQVLGEAQQLLSRQSEVASRLEVIRRQRYNRWATDQIEKALDFYNANVSHYNPFNDNAVLIGALVKNLGEVDPAILEPAVLELYNYVIERTKGSISEKNKLELAKRLTDPAIRRKALGDF